LPPLQLTDEELDVLRAWASKPKVLQGDAHDFCRVDDAGAQHVDILFGLADASPTSSRTPVHGSGPMWVASPSSQWTHMGVSSNAAVILLSEIEQPIHGRSGPRGVAYPHAFQHRLVH
jgi:hypothetical protein